MTPSIDIVRCVVEHPDYFQGAPLSTFVGMGDTVLAALDDALETCAANGKDSAGADLPCGHCGKPIPSEYGDPNADSQEQA